MPHHDRVYKLPFDIPELGYVANDHLIVRPDHEKAAVLVVKRFGPESLETALSKTRDARPLVKVLSEERVRCKCENHVLRQVAPHEWVFILDAPEVPALRGVPVGEPHAQEGDVLREREDEATPFELHRERPEDRRS